MNRHSGAVFSQSLFILLLFLSFSPSASAAQTSVQISGLLDTAEVVRHAESSDDARHEAADNRMHSHESVWPRGQHGFSPTFERSVIADHTDDDYSFYARDLHNHHGHHDGNIKPWIHNDHDDVAPVPLPPAVWLLASGIAGLALTSRWSERRDFAEAAIP